MLATAHRTTGFRFGRRGPTQAEIREARIAELEKLAKGLKLGWGGVEKGNIVTVYFEKHKYQFRGLPPAELWLNLWCEEKRKNYRAWRRWYDWVRTADQRFEFYRQQAARRGTRRTREEMSNAV
jgi:hypothetical protein